MITLMGWANQMSSDPCANKMVLLLCQTFFALPTYKVFFCCWGKPRKSLILPADNSERLDEPSFLGQIDRRELLYVWCCLYGWYLKAEASKHCRWAAYSWPGPPICVTRLSHESSAWKPRMCCPSGWCSRYVAENSLTLWLCKCQFQNLLMANLFSDSLTLAQISGREIKSPARVSESLICALRPCFWRRCLARFQCSSPRHQIYSKPQNSASYVLQKMPWRSNPSVVAQGQGLMLAQHRRSPTYWQLIINISWLVGRNSTGGPQPKALLKLGQRSSTCPCCHEQTKQSRCLSAACPCPVPFHLKRQKKKEIECPHDHVPVPGTMVNHVAPDLQCLSELVRTKGPFGSCLWQPTTFLRFFSPGIDQFSVIYIHVIVGGICCPL